MVKNNNNPKVIIATVHSWNIFNAKKFQAKNKDVILVTNPKKLTINFVRRHNPRYIFFPHWSWFIPRVIFENYECIVFHMTDLPYGRGGSPLQNLIVRGQRLTKISAIKVVQELDAGPIYLKAPLRLHGTAEEIFQRGSQIVFEKMIPAILEGKLLAKPQKGKVTVFKRRKFQDGCLNGLKESHKIYDYIRMLDAPGYPKAFFQSRNMTISFSKARVIGGKVLAQAEIICT